MERKQDRTFYIGPLFNVSEVFVTAGLFLCVCDSLDFFTVLDLISDKNNSHQCLIGFSGAVLCFVFCEAVQTTADEQ